MIKRLKRRLSLTFRGENNIEDSFAELTTEEGETNGVKENKAGIVHENPRILSDGESEEISGTSSEDYVSPVKLRNRPRRANDSPGMEGRHDYISPVKLRNRPRPSTSDEVAKRLSLPADMRLPGHFLTRQSLSPEACSVDARGGNLCLKLVSGK